MADEHENVVAFVATIEEYVGKGDGGADEKDTLSLCRIVRELAAELDAAQIECAHWRRATGCIDPATMEIALGRLYDAAECNPPCDGIPDGIDRIKVERDALRDRLAKLETCVVCGAHLLHGEAPPHCGDTCTVLEEHEAEWDNVRKSLNMEKGSADGKTSEG